MSMKRALFPAQFKALDDKGKVEAIVSVFGNVDRIGDRVMPGAFKRTIAEWKASGDPIPVILSHDWNDVWSHIGVVEELEEVEKGLKAVYSLDIDTNPVAAQVHRLMKRRSLKEHSFGYEIEKERSAKDGANELVDLTLIELGPTLKGMNDQTELLSVKSAIEEVAAETAEEEVVEPETKAGRRISRATESELSAAIDGMEKELQRLRGLLSAGDSEKQEEDDEDIAGKSSTDDDTTDNSVVDDDLLIYQTRIERLRD